MSSTPKSSVYDRLRSRGCKRLYNLFEHHRIVLCRHQTPNSLPANSSMMSAKDSSAPVRYLFHSPVSQISKRSSTPAIVTLRLKLAYRASFVGIKTRPCRSRDASNAIEKNILLSWRPLAERSALALMFALNAAHSSGGNANKHLSTPLVITIPPSKYGRSREGRVNRP